MDPLRRYRRDAKLTREALAGRARCSVAMLQMLEGGYRPAKSAVLRRVTAILAAELGTDYGELVARVNDSAASPLNGHEVAASDPVGKEGARAAHLAA